MSGGNGRAVRAREVLELEIEGIAALRDRLDAGFGRAVDLLRGRRGKIVVIGMGKSGIVGRKFAATLTSTGSPAVFLHPAEGLHGDFGIVQRGDVAVVISNSGASTEIISLLGGLKRLEVPVIAMTADAGSPLGRAADEILDVSVPREACPLNLAPTTSTTATLALCDALAVVLLEELGFTPEDFGHLHPGGALGRRLRRVHELMHEGDAMPLVREDTPMPEVLVVMTERRLGIAGVVAADGRLSGVITDGDLRRALENRPDLLQTRAAEIMTHEPKTVPPHVLAQAALGRLEAHKITCLFVVDDAGKPVGVLHLHDLLRGGLG